MSRLPLVFIGMPVYNGQEFLSDAINSIRNQTFKNWQLHISDNFSTDSTASICKRFVKVDSRIYYSCQKKHVYAFDNFELVLSKANCEYFMWASDDDLWSRDFIVRCLSKLQDNQCDFAFSNLVNIDRSGRIVRHYPGFAKYQGLPGYKKMTKVLLESEVLGKSNLIYSIFRTDFCQTVWKIYHKKPIKTLYADNTLTLGLLSRGKFGYVDKVLMKKRIYLNNNKSSPPLTINKIFSIRHIVELKQYFNYLEMIKTMLKDTQYYYLGVTVTLARLPLVTINTLLDKIRSVYLVMVLPNVHRLERLVHVIFSK